MVAFFVGLETGDKGGGGMYWIMCFWGVGGRLWFEDLDRFVLLNLPTLHFIVACNYGWADARNLLEGLLKA